MWSNLRETGDLVTFTAEILNGKLYFLSSDALFNSFSYIIIIIFCWLLLIVTKIFKKCNLTLSLRSVNFILSES